MKGNQIGRSMIEMLGVLAIIGVLSVGAIAGYSKAMMKYKLNKQAEQLNTLFSIAQQYVGQFYFNNDYYNYLIPTFKKLNLIPPEMFIKNDTGSLKDVFGNKITIYAHGNQVPGYENDLRVKMFIYDKTNHEMCRNILLVAKEYADTFNNIEIFGNKGQIIFQGYNNCIHSNSLWRCATNLDLQQMDEMCNLYDESDSYMIFAITWKQS